MTTCPTCHGERESACFMDGFKDGIRCGWVQTIPCDTCGGTGEIDETHANRIAAGQRLRERRRAHQMSSREWAKRFDIEYTLYLRIERGEVEHPMLEVAP